MGELIELSYTSRRLSIHSISRMTRLASFLRAVGSLYGLRIMPAASRLNRPVRFRRPPGARFVLVDRCHVFQDRVHNAPCRFNTIHAGEKRRVAPDGLAEEALIRRHLLA